jgi:hypothetical protein
LHEQVSAAQGKAFLTSSSNPEAFRTSFELTTTEQQHSDAGQAPSSSQTQARQVLVLFLILV